MKKPEGTHLYDEHIKTNHVRVMYMPSEYLVENQIPHPTRQQSEQADAGNGLIRRFAPATFLPEEGLKLALRAMFTKPLHAQRAELKPPPRGNLLFMCANPCTGGCPGK
jgi:hypothetical protein